MEQCGENQHNILAQTPHTKGQGLIWASSATTERVHSAVSEPITKLSV